MTEDDFTNLSHDLVKEALEKEFDALKTPAAQGKWQKLELEYQKQLKRRNLLSLRLSRLAAVVVIILAVGFSSFGMLQSLKQKEAVSDSAALAPKEEELLLPENNEDIAPSSVIAEEGEAGAWVEKPQAAEGKMEDDSEEITAAGFGEEALEWPLFLAENYRLQRTIILDEQNDLLSLGAIYKGDGLELMFVRSPANAEPFAQFAGHLSELIGVEITPTGESGKYIEFQVFEMPGLAWQDGQLSQALFVVSGNLEAAELEAIAADIK